MTVNRTEIPAGRGVLNGASLADGAPSDDTDGEVLRACLIAAEAHPTASAGSGVAADGAPCNRVQNRRRDLSNPQARARWLLDKARKDDKRLLRRLDKAVKEGKRHKAASLRRRYVRSWPARLIAAWHALKREARRWGILADPIHAFDLAQRLDLRRPCKEPVRVSARQKKTGGYRPISSPGTERYARMLLAKRAAAPFVNAELRPEQYGVPGRGRDDCVAEVRERLRQRDNNGGYRYAHVLTADITDMYGSFAKERLPALLNDVTGKEVAEHTLLTRERNLKATRSVRTLSPEDANGVLAKAGRGLPQGSPASPLVAQLMVARVLRAVQVQRGVAVLVYADNVIVLGRRRADVEATKDDLCSAFASSAAGRLDLRLEGVHRARDGFEFLGYAIRRTACSTRIEVPDGKKEAIRVKLLAALARVKGGVARKDELLKTVRGIGAGLKLADVGLLMMCLLGRYILLLDDPPDELREAFRLADKLCLGRGWPGRACAG